MYALKSLPKEKIHDERSRNKSESAVGEKGHSLKKLLHHILNILYPRCCPVCQKILKDQSLLVCPECGKELRPISQPRCMRCGKPVKEEEEFCRDCAGKEREFFQGRGIYLYDSRMKASILRYKYDGRRQYGDFYARAMCLYAREDVGRWKPDLIVPVPLHPRKKRMRGFNQAEYIADQVGEFFKIPVDKNLLKKVKETKSQKKMDAAQRRRNLKTAFAACERTDGKTVLVIDDVYTTGSTVEAAAKCLKEAGAARVCFLTVCMESD